MSLPLYRNHHAPNTLPSEAHAGLWFDKFCDQWPPSGWSLKSAGERNPKLDWIRTVTGKPIGQAKLLEEQTQRLSALARASSGATFHFKTASRFATGLGREHPIENGFVWHPVLGTPFLPGSSVKGLVRAWAKSWAEKTSDHDAVITRIFGPRGFRSTAAHTGSVVFFDALPTKPVQLAADVMTPHYGPYYERGEVPGDWHSPVPIPFLTVAPGQSFIFALAPRTSLDSDRADCHTAAGWLETALIELGAGAKTAVGYGRFGRDAAAEAEEQAAERHKAQAAREAEAKAALVARLAYLSPAARELELAADQGKWDLDKNAFAQSGIIEGWLNRLEMDFQSDAFQRLCELMNLHFPGLLKDPDKTEGKKKNPTFKERQRALAKRIKTLSVKLP